MALVKKQVSRKRIAILLSAFVGLLVAGILYLNWSTGSGPARVADTTDPQVTKLQQEMRSVQTMNQSLLADLESLLEDKRYQELQQFGIVPVTVGAMGKANPFQPF